MMVQVQLCSHGESAIGKYPLECVKTMDKIARHIESNINYWGRFKRREYIFENITIEEYEFQIDYSICETARNIEAKAIVSYTERGDTPRIISSFLPPIPIIAITPVEKTYRQLALAWNVVPILIEKQEVITDAIASRN